MKSKTIETQQSSGGDDESSRPEIMAIVPCQSRFRPHDKQGRVDTWSRTKEEQADI
jgi:hypothetical protein